MEAELRAGIALFNAGYFHAAHDAWEDRWLDLEKGFPDEQFLHGLIQYTAAIHHLEAGNREGALGLAESAREYLEGLPDPYREVSLRPIRHTLHAIETSGAELELTDDCQLRYADRVIQPTDLDGDAVGHAARIIADAEGWEAAPVSRGIEIAREEPDGRIAGMLQAFVSDPDNRATIHRLLGQHVDREWSRRTAIDELFDDSEE